MAVKTKITKSAMKASMAAAISASGALLRTFSGVVPVGAGTRLSMAADLVQSAVAELSEAPVVKAPRARRAKTTTDAAVTSQEG